MSVKAFQEVRDQIKETAISACRDPASIALVAVTKGYSWEESAFLYECGQRDFGENRLNDALQKFEKAPPDCRLHLIGTLQSNKVRKAIGNFILIHSVDSFELLKKISELSQQQNLQTKVLLQANMSQELNKHGLSSDGWKFVIDEALNLKGVEIKGLMTMAKQDANSKEIGKSFASLRHLRDELEVMTQHKFPELSMGMSSDYKIAIQEGATILRIGSRLFQT